MVLTAHVHNYQRIEREIVKGSPSPFIVAGHGGYYHLHHFNKGVENGTVDDNNGAKLVAGEDKIHGYLTLSADGKSIVGFMTTIDKRTEEANPGADTFEYSAEPLFLEDAVTVSL
jgi:hypothetical protein